MIGIGGDDKRAVVRLGKGGNPINSLVKSDGIDADAAYGDTLVIIILVHRCWNMAVPRAGSDGWQQCRRKYQKGSLLCL